MAPAPGRPSIPPQGFAGGSREQSRLLCSFQRHLISSADCIGFSPSLHNLRSVLRRWCRGPEPRKTQATDWSKGEQRGGDLFVTRPPVHLGLVPTLGTRDQQTQARGGGWQPSPSEFPFIPLGFCIFFFHQPALISPAWSRWGCGEVHSRPISKSHWLVTLATQPRLPALGGLAP